jgi:hypothetical protein
MVAASIFYVSWFFFGQEREMGNGMIFVVLYPFRVGRESVQEHH